MWLLRGCEIKGAARDGGGLSGADPRRTRDLALCRTGAAAQAKNIRYPYALPRSISRETNYDDASDHLRQCTFKAGASVGASAYSSPETTNISVWTVFCVVLSRIYSTSLSYGIFGKTPPPNLVAALTALETTRRRFPTMPPNEKHSSLQNFTP